MVIFLDVAFLVESNSCCIVVEDENIEHQFLIRKVQHLRLCAQWREQVSLIPGAYPMLYGWGPDEEEIESALTELSQEHLDEEGSDDEQLNCTYDIEEMKIWNTMMFDFWQSREMEMVVR